MKSSNEKLLIYSALFLIILAGSFFRFSNLTLESFWLDETMSVIMSDDSISEAVTESSVDVHPPLYYLLLHVWMKITGTTEFPVRMLSVILGVLLLPYVFKLGEILYNSRAGLLSALIASLSPFLIKYSQEARAYSLLVLVSTASIYYFIVYLKQNKKKYSILYLIASILAIYTHFYGLFLIGAEIVYCLVLYFHKRIDKDKSKFLLQSFLIIGVSFIAWLPVLFKQFMRVQNGFWIPTPQLFNLGELFYRFSGSIHTHETILIIVILGSLFGMSLLFIRKKLNEEFFWSNILLLLWFIIIIVPPFVLSYITTPFFGIKYAISASVPFYILAGKSLSEIKPKYLIVILTGILTVLLVRNIDYYYKLDKKEDWRGLFSKIEHEVPSNQVVFIKGLENYSYALEYYRKRKDITYLLINDLKDSVELNNVYKTIKQEKNFFVIFRFKDFNNEINKLTQLDKFRVEMEKFEDITLYKLMKQTN